MPLGEDFHDIIELGILGWRKNQGRLQERFDKEIGFFLNLSFEIFRYLVPFGIDPPCHE